MRWLFQVVYQNKKEVWDQLLVHKNVPHLMLYQWTKFQCHTFFPFQDIKPNILLSSYLDS